MRINAEKGANPYFLSQSAVEYNSKIKQDKRLFLLTSDEVYDIKDITDELFKHPKRKYHKRKLSDIKRIVIHHSYTTQGSPRAYSRYHVKIKGWPGIAYHYVIQKSGNIYQTNSLDTISYHVNRRINQQAIGICLTGNFDIEHPTKEQYGAMIFLIKHVQNVLDRFLFLNFHRDFANKSCPGKNIDYTDVMLKAYFNK